MTTNSRLLGEPKPIDDVSNAYRNSSLASDLQAQLCRARSRPIKVGLEYLKFSSARCVLKLATFLPGRLVVWLKKQEQKYHPMRSLPNFLNVEEDIALIERSGEFRMDFYNPISGKFGSTRKAIRHFLLDGKLKKITRKPAPGFHPHIYASSAAETTSGDAFSHFLRMGQPEGVWTQQVIENKRQAFRPKNSDQLVALHLHIFYSEQLLVILERLQINATRPDLFVSTSTENLSVVRDILQRYEGKLIRLSGVPNSGRDIGPLLTEFGSDLVKNYDVIGHVHTKKSPHMKNRFAAAGWQKFLLENLIGGENGGAMMDAILARMYADPTVGIVYPDDPYVNGWDKNRDQAEIYAQRLLLPSLPDQFWYPAGTMCWMRGALLKRFVDLELSWTDYPVEPIANDGTMLHALERLIGVVAQRDGYRTVVTNVRGMTRL